MEEKFEVKEISGGQLRPYADSVYVYEVKSEEPKEEVEKYCMKEVHHSGHKGSDFSGSCDFPFGLSSFYSFFEKAPGIYTYKVCEPYAG